MPKKPKDIPAFASEAEELRFWDEHHPADYLTEPADMVVRLTPQATRPERPFPPDVRSSNER